MPTALRTTALTAFAMIAFAGNSVLNRMALLGTDIGPGAFTLVRLLSGAGILVLIVLIRGGRLGGNWQSAVALLVYASCFSYAYLVLPAGTGAIILFALVQISMLGWAMSQGDRLTARQWAGLTIAMAALIWLVSPGIEAPPLLAAATMAFAGVGWGAYSLLGRSASDPAAATAGNFVRACVIAAILAVPVLFVLPEGAPDQSGLAIAIVSGAVTSGLGYVVWYMALKSLTTSQAGISQLTVPAIAAFGGILFLSEPVTLRFALATAAILIGVGLAVLTSPPGSVKASQ